MQGFIRDRIHVGAWAVFVILCILFLQNSLFSSLSPGVIISRHSHLVMEAEMSTQIWNFVKVLVLGTTIAFWALDRKKWLGIFIVVSNLLLTFELLCNAILLVLTLGSDTSSMVNILIRDTVLVMIINILIFSLWYWIVDSPILKKGTSRESEPCDFLFPQRGTTIQGYADWNPGFPDYLFLAFTTTTAFGPTDTLPLSQRAKLLMLLQAGYL